MGTSLTTTVLVENTPVAGLAAEHGLSVHLCYEREGHTKRILLDFGQSDAFARDATALDVDLSAVDLAVLSHAHYDHANGLPAFCAANASARTGMLLHPQDGWTPDDFAHEVSLVVELESAPDGTPQLAVFNSCSHAGLPVIAAEVTAAFPGARIAAYVGGLHLAHAIDKEVAQVAAAIRNTGIGHVYTGHCIGNHALELLQRALPGRVAHLHPGMTMHLS